MAENSFSCIHIGIIHTDLQSHCLSYVLYTPYPESVTAPQGCAAGKVCYDHLSFNSEGLSRPQGKPLEGMS